MVKFFLAISSEVLESKEERTECGGRHGMLSVGDVWIAMISSWNKTIKFFNWMAISWAMNEFVCGAVWEENVDKNWMRGC